MGCKWREYSKEVAPGKEPHLAASLTLAQGSETAAKDVQEMNAPKQEWGSSSTRVKPKPVHKVTGKKPVTCHHCGTPGHFASVCKCRDCVYCKCKKRGHLARVCRSTCKSKPQLPSSRTRPKRPTSQTVQQVDEETDADSEDSLQPILTVECHKGHLLPTRVRVGVDNCSVPMEVDTGASESI